MAKLGAIWKAWFDPYRFKLAYGGRSGSKSYSICTIILIEGMKEKKSIVCLREFQKNLEDSVYQLLSDIINDDDQFRKFFKVRHDKIVGANGTQIKFSGIRNAVNFKSFQGADIAWVEEAQTISKNSMDILIPTIRKPNSEIWFAFNPYSIDDPIYEMMLNPRKSQLNLQINYMDNPFNPDVMIEEAEYCKEHNIDDYNHVWLGEPKSSKDSIIYSGSWQIKDFYVDTRFGMYRMNEEILEILYGIDFGFSSPSAVTEAFLYEGCLYINKEIYEQGLTTDDITKRMITEMPDCEKSVATIYADPNRPETIDEMRRARIGRDGEHLPGLDVRKALKGRGSVASGIAWIKNLQCVYIHPRCKNTIREFQTYSYKINVFNGKVSDEINKSNDHACFTADTYIEAFEGRILGTVLSGVKEVYEFLGSKVTKDHPYMTERGMIKLENLKYGDVLMVNGGCFRLDDDPKVRIMSLKMLFKTRFRGFKLFPTPFKAKSFNQESRIIDQCQYLGEKPVYAHKSSSGLLLANGVLVSNCDALRYSVNEYVVSGNSPNWASEDVLRELQ